MISSPPCARSSRRTRTSPTRPTPTTGPRSPARRGSGSCTSNPSWARPRTSSAPSSASSTPASTCKDGGGGEQWHLSPAVCLHPSARGPGRHGNSEGNGNRDRVRDHGQEPTGFQPDPLLVAADQLVRDLPFVEDPVGLRGGESAPGRSRVRVHGGQGGPIQGGVTSHQPDSVQRGALLRRPCTPGILLP